jgi:hypothetical protein
VIPSKCDTHDAPPTAQEDGDDAADESASPTSNNVSTTSSDDSTKIAHLNFELMKKGVKRAQRMERMQVMQESLTLSWQVRENSANSGDGGATDENGDGNISSVYKSIGKRKRPDGMQVEGTQQGMGSADERRVSKEPRTGDDQQTREGRAAYVIQSLKGKDAVDGPKEAVDEEEASGKKNEEKNVVAKAEDENGKQQEENEGTGDAGDFSNSD